MTGLSAAVFRPPNHLFNYWYPMLVLARWALPVSSFPPPPPPTGCLIYRWARNCPVRMMIHLLTSHTISLV